MKRTIPLLLSLTLLVACSQRIGDFTIISTKNVDIGGKFKKLPDRYEGSDSRGMILGIPLGYPNLKEAVDQCLHSGKGDLLTNAVLESGGWTAIVYGVLKYTVTADVWTKADVGDAGELFELQIGDRGYELRSSMSDAIVYVDFLLTD